MVRIDYADLVLEAMEGASSLARSLSQRRLHHNAAARHMTTVRRLLMACRQLHGLEIKLVLFASSQTWEASGLDSTRIFEVALSASAQRSSQISA